MSGTDLAAMTDKRLALAEAGGIEESHQLASPPRGPGIGNPAPLGLLCFGMTTGECDWARMCLLRAGDAFKLACCQLLHQAVRLPQKAQAARRN